MVSIRRHLLQEALAQRFVCFQMLMLPTLIMQSVLKVAVCGLRPLHQHKALTGTLELRGLQG